MADTTEPLCRCDPGVCWLHPSLTTCGMRERSAFINNEPVEGMNIPMADQADADRLAEYRQLRTLFGEEVQWVFARIDKLTHERDTLKAENIRLKDEIRIMEERLA